MQANTGNPKGGLTQITKAGLVITVPKGKEVESALKRVAKVSAARGTTK